MAGIKESKELLSWGLDTALDIKQIWANHKIDIGDIGPVYHIIRGAPTAFMGADEVVNEFWDYDDAERAELSKLVAGKLSDFGLSEEETEEAAILILDAMVADAKVARFFANMKKKSDDTTKG